MDTRGLRHRHSTTDCFTVNFRNLAFPLVYEFSNVLSGKRKRDTSPKEAGGGGGGCSSTLVSPLVTFKGFRW